MTTSSAIGGDPHPASRPNRRASIFRSLSVVVLAGVLAAAVVGCRTTPVPSHRRESGRVHRHLHDDPAHGVPIDPKEFAAGACVAFAPTAGDNHRTVFLDAGHGGIDPGAQGVTKTGQTIYEADETLPVELDTMALLRAKGYRVVVSRIDASNVARFTAGDMTNGSLSAAGVHVNVAARDICANMAKATILLGIYFDAGTSPANAGSLTAYDPARLFAADNLRLATLVQNDVLASMNSRGWRIPDDDVVSDTTLGGPALTTTAADYGHLLLLGPAYPPWFTTPSQMPGALIEPLFITDPFEGSIADSATGQQAIARGIAEAVEQYFTGKRAT